MNTIHRSRFDRIMHEAGIDDRFDSYDMWGTAVTVFSAVADVFNASDIDVEELSELFASDYYHEGQFSDDYSYETLALASALNRGDISQDDLIYAGDVLSKYTDILRLAGKDY